MFKYGLISSPYFPVFTLNTERYYLSVFSPNTGKYEPEITPYLDTFHAVLRSLTRTNTSPADNSLAAINCITLKNYQLLEIMDINSNGIGKFQAIYKQSGIVKYFQASESHQEHGSLFNTCDHKLL